ncbi:MAG: sulfatase-like hydrolase/transferase [Deltaproteobacteria bacterium]|nr:sulfatase-like hydrolase/transferase [Candidatus Tharpella sp.]
MLKNICKQWFQAVKPLLLFYLLFLLIALVGRFVLLGQNYAELKASGVNYWFAFIVGLRMDTIATCAILALPTLLIFLTPSQISHIIEKIVGSYLLATLLIAVYMEIATPPFVNEFNSRPNELFVNYLQYPREVLKTIFSTQLTPLLIALVSFSLITWLYCRWWRQSPLFGNALKVNYGLRLLFFLPTAFIIVMGIRSSLGHRPANLSDATYSNSHIANELAKNTLHSVGYSVYAKKKFNVNVKLYGRMDASEAIARTQKILNLKREDLIDPSYPLLRHEKSHFPDNCRNGRPKNLVVIIQESLGAQFVEAVGGQPGITPNLNRLAQEGILFENLYASGTRSVRGMEAIVGGFLPIPGTSVLKRNLSQKDFFSLAQLLKPLGFDSSFLYGGEKRFDNMGSWYYGNGFDRVIDEPLFVNPIFHGIWGVCDEDLIVRADAEYTKLHQQKKPFLSVFFTTTNHTPFEFPEGRIKLIDGYPAACDKNGVKFADYAMGNFFALARKHGYYDDTIFVIIADHNVRVRSSPNEVMPVTNYRIFGLILGGGVTPLHYKRVATQMDVTATAIDLLGCDFSHPIIGRSIFRPNKNDFALMKFYSLYGFMRDGKLAVLEPKATARTYRVAGDDLLPLPHDQELERDGLALLTIASHLYHEQRHALPAKFAVTDK